MLKIKTRLISAVLTTAVAVTAAVAATVPVGAAAAGTANNGLAALSGVTTVNKSQFVQGISASNFTAKLNEGKGMIFVNWDNSIANTKYALYYIAVDDKTGKFGDWTVKSIEGDGSSFGPGFDYKYEIVLNEHGFTYYVTVLPYTDTPSRQYGNFSPYAVIKT